MNNFQIQAAPARNPSVPNFLGTPRSLKFVLKSPIHLSNLFSSVYPIGTPFVIELYQDEVGGHGVTWGEEYVFSSEANIATEPNALTTIDLLKVDSEVWRCTVRFIPGAVDQATVDQLVLATTQSAQAAQAAAATAGQVLSNVQAVEDQVDQSEANVEQLAASVSVQHSEALAASESADQSAYVAETGANLASGYAAAAASVSQQDLSGAVSAALHRSPNAVTAMFIYDTSNDSDGGAWVERMGHTSWMNEPLSGAWLGQQVSELQARYVTSAVGPEMLVAADFSTATGWSLLGAVSVSGGEGVFTAAANGAALAQAALTLGKVYRVTFTIKTISSGAVRPYIGSTGVGTSRTTSGTYTEYITCSGNTSVTFTAIGTTTAAIDNVSVREATSITSTGDYFQLTTDGKFYKLNAGTGVTEVFRGNKAKFPRLSAIVAEASTVTIYDLTETGRPMWMRFTQTSRTTDLLDFWRSGRDASSCAALNGKVIWGQAGASNTRGICLVDFAADKLLRYLPGSSASGAISGVILAAKVPLLPVNLPTSIDTVNAVAMTVLPDAPFDAVTGLQIPTIAVATQAGLSVIKSDGTVGTTFTWPSKNVSFDRRGNAVEIGENSRHYRKVLAPNYTAYVQGTGGAIALNTTPGTLQHSAVNKHGKVLAAMLQLDGQGLFFVRDNDQDMSRYLAARVAPFFSTGYLVGDIRRAYLCDTVVESVSTPVELVTNGTFDTDTSGWTGNNAALNAVSGAMRLTVVSNGTATATIPITTVVGKTYKVSFNVVTPMVPTTYTSIGISTSVGSGYVLNPSVGQNFAGSYSFTFAATATTMYVAIMVGTTAPAGSFVDVDSVSVKLTVGDRSWRASGANINGTLTKTQAATAAQLVAYSGFSATNYLQEPYSEDLDVGTGALSFGCWFSSPAVLPVNSLPVVGAETVADLSSFTTYNANGAVSASSGSILCTCTAAGNYGAKGVYTYTAGKNYLVTLSWSGNTSNRGIAVDSGFGTGVSFGTATSGTAVAKIAAPTGTATGAHPIVYVGGGLVGESITVTQLSIKEVGPSIALDRSATTGPYYSLGMDGAGKLIATVSDGTTTRTVTTTVAYNTGLFTKARATYSAGKLAITINGVEVASTTGAALQTLNNPAAVLTIGNSRTLDAPFPGSLTLLKIGATVPTTEQSLWMYEQEKQMFREGAQVTLPSSSTVSNLAYDESQDKWVVVQAGHESTYTGLVRTSVSTPTAGSYTKAEARSGVRVIARTATNPGVDVSIPAYGLREELIRRGEGAARQSKPLTPFDFDTISFTAAVTAGSPSITASAVSGTPYLGMGVTGTGIPAGTAIIGINGSAYTLSANATATGAAVSLGQCDFTLPQGWVAVEVLNNGVGQREGATKNFARLYDGFRETVRFAVSPSATSWVRINARKE